ncbi:predicted acyl-CoA transferase/carnitine dehydratase [Hahella chejuensis KCTC 2396]|uniref:Predicted acyl-CoA transferase/carnitine dehydratase n=1 Tax=Hahella chejuensis (strain KCTC 2396) TaxID=349521 RepID=Q2SI99_HAHCH|nr:CoA transferase [Hahella chejuensis]ABC29625.1 predicted acyl-CoA transferase/carnitine dehydratase [Hahella chejuensis KCTC 2396]
MAFLLEGCYLSGSLRNPTPAHAPLYASLLYQANALGMGWENVDTESGAAFALHSSDATADATAIDCVLEGWSDAVDRPITENLAQAASGLMSVHGRASGGAQPLGVDYVSTLTAMLSLQGVMAAAIGRQRGASMRSTATSMTAAALLSVAQYLAGATAPDMPERLLPGGANVRERPPFVSADGVAFELETLDAGPWRAFWSHVGVDAASAGKGWNGFLLRYAKAIAPVPAALCDALATLPFEAIAQIASQTGVAICKVRTLQERAQDPDASTMWRNGPWRFQCDGDAAQATPIKPCAPNTSLPLAGLTVVESCRRIQGPLAGRLLSLLGAEVIRIEPPGGDPLRGMPPMAEDVSARFDALNRDKKILEIDIKSAAGKAEVMALIKHAEVFLHNWAPGKAAEMGLDYDDMKQVNPDLVYAYAGGWGETAEHDLPGTDFMAQAYSGVAAKIAAASGLPGGALFTVLDVLGGAVAAQGVTAALLARALGRARSIRVDSSLLGAASLLCAEDLGALLNPSGDKGVSMATEESHSAPTSLNGVYATAQGLLAIDCLDERAASRLARAVAEAEPAANESGGLNRERLQRILNRRKAQEWAALFETTGAPAAAIVEDLTEISHDPRLASALNKDAYIRVNSPWRFQ